MIQKEKFDEVRLKLNAPCAYKQWTENEDRDLIELLHNGKSHEEISQKHQRTIGAINSHLKKIAMKMITEENKSLKDASDFVRMDEFIIHEALLRKKNKKKGKRNHQRKT